MNEGDLDLTGFSAAKAPKARVPPPPAKRHKAEEGEAERFAPVERSESERAGNAASPETTRPKERGRKKRVNVSLPVELSRRFTERAAGEDRYLTVMVLDAYRDHFAGLRNDYLAQRGNDTGLPFRPRRRKGATGRVTHMLYLAAPEVAVIDGSALEVGMSRSELVAHLLERAIG